MRRWNRNDALLCLLNAIYGIITVFSVSFCLCLCAFVSYTISMHVAGSSALLPYHSLYYAFNGNISNCIRTQLLSNLLTISFLRTVFFVVFAFVLLLDFSMPYRCCFYFNPRTRSNCRQVKDALKQQFLEWFRTNTNRCIHTHTHSNYTEFRFLGEDASSKLAMYFWCAPW